VTSVLSPAPSRRSGARTPRRLVAGVGNVLLGDDGFGVEVARRLRAGPLPDGVRVADFGIRALHLAYELLEPYDAVVVVDAVARGGRAGTVVVLEPDVAELEAADAPDAHGLHPAAVLRIARALGASLDRVRVVGCEPADVSERIGLSAPVERAVDHAVRIVQDLLARGDS
jgi:hydrogenase maturation protease